MNAYYEEWLRHIGLFETGAKTGTEPELVQTSNHKKQIGSTALRAAGLIALADGPLPMGDAVAAGILAATGAYLLLS